MVEMEDVAEMAHPIAIHKGIDIMEVSISGLGWQRWQR